MTDRNILEQKKIEIGGIKGQVEDLFKGEFKRTGNSRIVAGLDAMLGKRADITSRVVAS